MALARACRKGDLERVRDLLNAGAELRPRARLHQDPLFNAIAYRRDAVVLLLLERGAPLFEGCLHMAAQSSREPILRALLQQLNVDERDRFGMTPLMWAAVRPRSMRVLLNRGASVHVRDAMGQTPLHHVALVGGTGEAVDLLVDAGAQVDARDREGFTPLHHAARVGAAEAIAALLDRGARRELRTGLVDDMRPVRTWTALEFAREIGYEDCARLLEGDPNAPHWQA